MGIVHNSIVIHNVWVCTHDFSNIHVYQDTLVCWRPHLVGTRQYNIIIDSIPLYAPVYTFPILSVYQKHSGHKC